jgi:hypothetical protein
VRRAVHDDRSKRDRRRDLLDLPHPIEELFEEDPELDSRHAAADTGVLAEAEG